MDCANAQKPITTDLRRWFDQHMRPMADDELREGFGNLCAAIDAVQANLERENDALYAENDALRHERDDGWMELPLDADGEPIRVGDTVDTPSWKCEMVEGILPDRVLLLRDDNWITVRADWCTHRQPDTWERIIKDARTCTGSTGNYTSVPTMRWTNELDALVARCRALAGDAS